MTAKPGLPPIFPDHRSRGDTRHRHGCRGCVEQPVAEHHNVRLHLAGRRELVSCCTWQALFRLPVLDRFAGMGPGHRRHAADPGGQFEPRHVRQPETHRHHDPQSGRFAQRAQRGGREKLNTAIKWKVCDNRTGKKPENAAPRRADAAATRRRRPQRRAPRGARP